MLSRSSKPSSSSSIPALGGVHPIQEYVADLQSKPPKDFPDIDEENQDGNEDHEEAHQITAEGNNNSGSDFMQLMPKKDFSELFQQFFVVGHKKLTLLQSKILLERDTHSDALMAPSNIDTHKIQVLRQNLYNLQVNIFKNPKGQQYNTLL
ncbi:hypothetical protein CK503_05880 [Aliifodinibius salipaludis]|uniref:Uncharacterized protein n=1 Tax=Fodinibius salipaludis TaxID=2032627 RepID=A0A2A2GCT4_9BACT|nr:hypothetical protein [Aliifodinibius salipaludis]PAU94990.1 hypothetical protein CK503_05880 [Aliifodinibius salipaludis]